MEYNHSFVVLQEEINWLQDVIDQAIKTYLLHEGYENNWQDIPLPDLAEFDCIYSNIVIGWELDIYARLALILSITPHLKPEALDVFFSKNQLYDKGFTEFGGVIDKNHSGFLPTGQTLSFLISSGDPLLKVEALKIFEKDSILIKEQVISLSATENHIPNLNGILSIEENWIHYFFTGTRIEPQNSILFPAQKITTNMDWEDVVLDHLVMEQVQEINKWLTHGETLMNEWGLFKKIKQGYKVLFCGPPGTGKTLSATLIGKAAQRDVYQVDLSMVVSKYIGETEKNLATIFDTAANKNWISNNH